MSKTKRSTGAVWQENLAPVLQAKRKGFGSQKPGPESWQLRLRSRVVYAACVCLMAVLFSRLVYLQIFESGQQVLLAQSNHIELYKDESARGTIFDRNGKPLTENRAVTKEDRGHEVKTFARAYPLAEAGAPVTGYISQVTEEELGCLGGICYSPGSQVGRAGAEKMFERYLKGKDGGRLTEVDAVGAEVRELGQNEPEKGEDVYLSIDSRLQQAMYESIKGAKGSAVAMDLQGKVLGLVSVPAYDPNLFTVAPDAPKLQSLLSDRDQNYFLNRAIAGTYPPGSVFKLVTAYAGLESGELTRDTKIEDTGEIRVGSYRYGNWYFDQYGRTEGQIDLPKALARSNDVFFYKVGEMVGVDRLVETAGKFGIGQKTGIELPTEAAGLLPDRLWKERTTGEKWFLGNTYHLSIGQGDLQVTPLQVARMTAAAVSGRVCDVSIQRDSTVECRDLGLTSEETELVREGMKAACATGGTAFPFFGFEPYVLCKTGTAQHAGQVTDEDKAHAWITVAYPGENPTMILTVMLEGAGEGSYEAGPIAKDILTKWRDLGNL